jgi:putative ABC transport system permease protein
VTAEFAIALPLLLGAGLLANSFVRLQRVDPGFNPDGVLGLALSLPRARYDSASIQPFWRRIEARTLEVPGVTAAGLSASIPPDNGGDVNNFDLLDRPVPAGTSQPAAPWSAISNGYLTAMGVRLLAGRLFNEADSATAPPVVLVSRAWAAKYYPGEDPLGRRMYNGGCTTCPPTTVVGVVSDVQYLGIGSDGVAVYMPLAQDEPRFLYLIARAPGAPAATLRAIRTALGGLDGQIAPQEIIMTERLHDALGDPRRWAVVVGGFALAGVVLAALGVFGLMSYVVRQRQREIGVRMALGATPDSVIWLVLSRGMRYAVAGTAIGLVVSGLESRWLGSLLYGVAAADPATIVIAVVTLTIIATVACLVPGLRAARIRPIEAISSD